MNEKKKPLGRKAYGSIAHLPISKMGQGDKRVHRGQAEICLIKKRDKHDEIIVQEKLDGSCVSVYKDEDGELHTVTRAGYYAETSPYEMHHKLSDWVNENKKKFDELLKPGDRVIGEWMIQAHGTVYNLPHEPFVVFDIMKGTERVPFDEFMERTNEFATPGLIHRGDSYPLCHVFYDLGKSFHGAVKPEGVIYRVQRKGEVDFLCKFVRPDFEPGKHLFNESPVWNTYV